MLVVLNGVVVVVPVHQHQERRALVIVPAVMLRLVDRYRGGHHPGERQGCQQSDAETATEDHGRHGRLLSTFGRAAVKLVRRSDTLGRSL
jgi:hypothetical protein